MFIFASWRLSGNQFAQIIDSSKERDRPRTSNRALCRLSFFLHERRGPLGAGALREIFLIGPNRRKARGTLQVSRKAKEKQPVSAMSGPRHDCTNCEVIFARFLSSWLLALGIRSRLEMAA